MKAVKKVVLAPLDPVHDIGLKMIRRGLEQAGHVTWLMPPDYSPQEIVKGVIERQADVVLISRTLGYGVEEILARFVDLVDAAGIRERVKLGVGGMAIRPELAAELGFDAGFGPGTAIEAAVAFVEGREYVPSAVGCDRQKYNILGDADYSWRDGNIGGMLDAIADQVIAWAAQRTSPGVKRARLREEIIKQQADAGSCADLKKEYAALSDPVIADCYQKGVNHPQTRRLEQWELTSLREYVARTQGRMTPTQLRHSRTKPGVFAQYGTGCPFMDIAHIKVAEAWGADGVVHFDPSWGARTEGFMEGYYSHSQDGSVITPENLAAIKAALLPSTLWQVRAHRGLNTPETVVLAGHSGADLTKINICYGALGAGTEPARLTVDGVESIKLAVKYGLPFDVVTNEELCGVPAHKAFAGMLIVANIALRLGAKPILQPLFCYSPEVMINEAMADNYIDFNAAKILALRQIIAAPIWPGAPIGFLTQTEERVQSSVSTGLHAALAASLGVEAISIATSDEAYSGGPIAAASRIDTLRAVKENFRFFGQAKIEPTQRAKEWAEQMVEQIGEVLANVLSIDDFVQALYQGALGTRDEGAYPGRAGKDTVSVVK